MTEARVGRLLAACLHQAIVDRLPQRLEFYEHWLNSEGLRDGSIGLAPIVAVLGFLRTEGAAYEGIVERAGTLAAEWSVESLSPLERRAIMWLPRGLRARAALRVTARIAASICSATKASSRVRRRTAQLSVKASLFCDVRENRPLPLCGFYRALAERTLAAFGVPAVGRRTHSHAVVAGPCIVTLDLSGARIVPDPAMAA